MILASVAPAPSFIDRFRAAWRGEESLAWVFWSYYVSLGLGLVFIQIAVRYVLVSVSGSEFAQFSATPIGQAYAPLTDLVQIGHLSVGFILFVRCISNVNWSGWQYAAMLFLLGVGYSIVEQARNISAVFLGG